MHLLIVQRAQVAQASMLSALCGPTCVRMLGSSSAGEDSDMRPQHRQCGHGRTQLVALIRDMQWATMRAIAGTPTRDCRGCALAELWGVTWQRQRWCSAGGGVGGLDADSGGTWCGPASLAGAWWPSERRARSMSEVLRC
ncbi:hypothetical protein K438DRAFT_1759780 [Mycena galopus ATCC 62051]|nr:hypothetical protein K438DRAFT_1759780 [Mycena galopus ATCC 62051]